MAFNARPHLSHDWTFCLQEEEIGLNGAKALDNAALKLTGTRLVNMDSEEWGEICIGCAGGGHSIMTLPAPLEAAPPGFAALQISVSGLIGGHSGLMIAEGRCAMRVRARHAIVMDAASLRWVMKVCIPLFIASFTHHWWWVCPYSGLTGCRAAGAML